MAGEILLDNYNGKMIMEGERGLFENLEEKISHLLIKYQELKEERDALTNALNDEKEKTARLEKRMELLTQDREKVKSRIDQLLHRLKGIDI